MNTKTREIERLWSVFNLHLISLKSFSQNQPRFYVLIFHNSAVAVCERCDAENPHVYVRTKMTLTVTWKIWFIKKISVVTLGSVTVYHSFLTKKFSNKIQRPRNILSDRTRTTHTNESSEEAADNFLPRLSSECELIMGTLLQLLLWMGVDLNWDDFARIISRRFLV